MRKEFVKTDILGTLWYDYILVEDAIPEFFIAIDSNQTRYLVVLTAVDHVYILTEVSTADIQDLIYGTISMAKPFLRHSLVYQVDSNLQLSNIEILRSKNLTLRQIPSNESIFECEEEDEEYLNTLVQSGTFTDILRKLKSFCNEQFWEGSYV